MRGPNLRRVRFGALLCVGLQACGNGDGLQGPDDASANGDPPAGDGDASSGSDHSDSDAGDELSSDDAADGTETGTTEGDADRGETSEDAGDTGETEDGTDSEAGSETDDGPGSDTGSSEAGSETDHGTGSDTGSGTSGEDDSATDGGGDSAEGGGDSTTDDGGDSGDDPPPDPVGPTPIVAYWGQNGWGGAHLDQPERWEASLAETCRDADVYDIVVLAFVISFVDTRNEDGLPAMNFSFHCEESYDSANPFVLRCPEIEAGIKTCHQLGKTVLLSLGGASGSYGFTSDEQARQFARTTWNMFMGGDHEYRPFGTAVIDGIDLDIEGGASTGYTAFVQELSQIIDLEGEDRKFYIAAAPQCVFPDAYLGSTFEQAGNLFDFLFVQFYNNWCRYGMNTGFNFAEWSSLHQAGSGPQIVVGLPATEEAAGSGYVGPAQLPALAQLVTDDPAFGGFMVWDASFDQNSDVGGQRYSQILEDLL